LLLIPGLAGARVVSQLADGVASASWLVESGGERFVLRVDKPEAETLGLDRRAERDIQAAVARAGLTSAPLFHDLERGVSLRRHAPGRAWSAADLQHARNLERLGRSLRDLHALPPAGARFEPGAAARRYARQIASPEAQRIADEANQLLAALRFEPWRECLCHNDLVADNIVDDGEQLLLIDWEYAGIGDQWFDLAVIVQHHELAPELQGILLHAYLGRAATDAESARLQAWCRFYRLLLELWLQRMAVAHNRQGCQGE
jgi:aminoglycoside phosphotransferase (APT) family kinase protein